ncbi:MAG TPA: ATP-binding protein [Caulobacteraceae bacterium]|jgi:signal transduction histidine kinase/ActR/RegA family two-component response regulator|nr:ATP-binding protein [Caulobacteraceae bacterium]
MNDQLSGPSVGARGITFESRIAIASLVTAVVVLLTASTLFIFEQWQAQRADALHDQATLTQVLATELAPAAGGDDVPAASRVLGTLAATPSIQSAVLRDVAGKTLARYDTRRALRARDPQVRSNLPVSTGGRRVGALEVVSRAPGIDAILPRYLAVCGALFFAATGLALFMGRWLAGRVVGPVNQLSKVMRDVADSGDYSQRVPAWAEDEFGLLTRSFNQLLTQLQANDSALHRAMTELLSARDEAQAANVLKSQFLANMSHEIRTPLNGVLAMAQIIALGELSPVQRERIGVIRRSGEELLAVLNDVLDLSRIEAGKMEMDIGEVDAEALAANVRAAFQPVADTKKKMDFSIAIHPNAIGPRRGDPARVAQILNNLVSNALKFTPEGEVLVTIEGTGEGGREGLRFVVADTGVGIPKDKLPLLFQKFSQADGSNTRRFGGTGLGLAICRELAQLMKGDIHVESREGEGSVFTVDLPLIAIEGAGVDGAASAAVDEDRPLRVLAAEDIPTNQLVLRTIMQSFGVDLEMVGNGREAVAAWQRSAFDVILMDIQMPEMDGVSATRAIRAEEAASGRARTPIIAVSANAMPHHTREYLSVGMDGHVAKPIELTKLHAAIEDALKHGPARQTAVA